MSGFHLTEKVILAVDVHNTFDFVYNWVRNNSEHILLGC